MEFYYESISFHQSCIIFEDDTQPYVLTTEFGPWHFY